MAAAEVRAVAADDDALRRRRGRTLARRVLGGGLGAEDDDADAIVVPHRLLGDAELRADAASAPGTRSIERDGRRRRGS